MKKYKLFVPLSILASLSLISCGPSEGGSSSSLPPLPRKEEVKEPIKERIDGQYMGVLHAVNDIVTGPVYGAATLAKDNDEFVADLRFNGGPTTASILHMQSVHAGERCPEPADDFNGDGIIDAVEGEEVYGDILVPLDPDLNTQRVGWGIWPLADAFGGYIYASTASWQKFTADLKERDINLEDNIAKLDPRLDFKMQGKVVVILGVAANTPLPETVRSNSRLDNFQTLPIACTVLEKVAGPPGEIDDDVPDEINSNEGQIGGPNGRNDGAVIVIPTREIKPPSPQ